MRRLWIVGLAFAAAASLAVAQKVDVEYDKNENFRKYSTWAWNPDTPLPPPNVRVGRELLDKIIREAVAAQFEDKKYREVEADQADFWVTYAVFSHAEMDKTVYDPGNIPWSRGNYGDWRPFFGGETATSIVQKGRLILDFSDTSDRTLFWRGTAEEIVKDDNPNEEKARKVVERAVKKMMKRFPKHQG